MIMGNYRNILKPKLYDFTWLQDLLNGYFHVHAEKVREHPSKEILKVPTEGPSSAEMVSLCQYGIFLGIDLREYIAEKTCIAVQSCMIMEHLRLNFIGIWLWSIFALPRAASFRT